ncbi:MAG: DUF4157 domain-containing protein [Pseudomonadota bacterium]
MAGPDHPAEREAEAVANHVLSMPDRVPTVQQMAEGIPVQRMEEEEEILQTKCNCDGDESLQMMGEEEEEPLQMMGEEEEEPLQMMGEEEEEPLQMMGEEEEEEVMAKGEVGSSPRSKPHSPMKSATKGLGAGQPLPDRARQFFEPRIGADFSNVRIHNGTDAARRASGINAEAFTWGSNIVFNSSRYDPNGEKGRHLLAHELTHVVQQGKAGQHAIQRSEDGSPDGSGGSSGTGSSGSSDARQRAGTPSAAAINVHVIGSERDNGTEFVDRRLVRTVEAVAAQDNGARLVPVQGFQDMVDQLSNLVTSQGCIRTLTVWNHAKPLTGSQGIAKRTETNSFTGQSVEHADAFSSGALLGPNAFDRNQVTRFRHLFCCGGRMVWRGCANLSFVAPEGGVRPELAAESAGADDMTTSRAETRYGRFGDVYHDRAEAEAQGATVLAGRDNRLGGQLWADALCIDITGTNDVLYPDPSSSPPFSIGHGGGEVDVAPSAACPCGADGRVSGPVPSQAALIELTEHVCSAEELDILHRSARNADLRMLEGIAALQGLQSRAPADPVPDGLPRLAEHALAGAFNIGIDFHLAALMGAGATQAADHAEGMARMTQVLDLLRAARGELQPYLTAPSCPVPSSSASAPCFSCKADQFPRCERSAVAFVRENSAGFLPDIGVCPSFYRGARAPGGRQARRSSIIVHEMTHRVGTDDAINGNRYYGCPVVRSDSVPVDIRWFRTPTHRDAYVNCITSFGLAVDDSNLSVAELLRIADAYRCFIDQMDGSAPAARPRTGPRQCEPLKTALYPPQTATGP